MFWCDNRCSDKALSFWQLTSVVVEDGEVSYTANFGQQCYNKKLVAKGGAPLKNWQWYAVVEDHAHRGRLKRRLVCDGRQSLRHFCHLSCVVLFCYERLS